MQRFPTTLVVRHRKERLSKCSLRGLEDREDFAFFKYPQTQLPPTEGAILLALDAPPLEREEGERGLLLLDATWRYAERMYRDIRPTISVIERSIPLGACTAYPRRQEDCRDEEAGLASIEALYIAYTILGRPTKGLLDRYHWKEAFLEKNKNYLNQWL